MELMKQIEELIQPCLDQHHVLCDSITFQKEAGMKILRIAIMHADGSMDLDTCADVSESISEVLDAKDPIAEDYYLEVCSVGAERVLKDEHDVHGAVGKYVHVELVNPFKGSTQFEGYLLDDSNQELSIEYMDKASKRKLQTPISNVKLIRLAVKF